MLLMSLTLQSALQSSCGFYKLRELQQKTLLILESTNSDATSAACVSAYLDLPMFYSA